ncbi:MAG TPA: VCBS repeat-containing protein [Bryobacteraceae bacterium]|nr:VCBS repeat-containing protein [Bryobacteraceae bacterium]
MRNIGPKKALCVAAILLGPLLWAVSRPRDIRFQKQQIDLGASETAAVADVNRDGKLDIISGEYWYAAPDWTPHKFRDLPYSNGYIDNFSDLPIDVDGDGRPDIVSCSWFRKSLMWWHNEGTHMWTEHVIDTGSPIEFAFLVDLNNDGKAQEVLPEFGDPKTPLAWYELSNGKFVKHQISDKSYGHGIGAGDVNGDGRTDIITPKGWFEAPPDPRNGQWIWHPDFDLGTTGFIYAVDINGDGRPDLVTSAAHDYGIFWMEQLPDHQWKKHIIDDTWSQAHAMTMVDLNGDGKPDFLTGKRYMAHDHDPGAREPLGIYWYEYLKNEDGSVVWVKHVIDYSTRIGAGMQLPVVDIDRDGRLDFVAPGKTGLFLFRGVATLPKEQP